MKKILNIILYLLVLLSGSNRSDCNCRTVDLNDRQGKYIEDRSRDSYGAAYAWVHWLRLPQERWNGNCRLIQRQVLKISKMGFK